mgnify:CR=1 FL=1
MLLGRERIVALRAIAMMLDVAVLVGAVRHLGARDVGEGHQQRGDLLLDGLLPGLGIGERGLEAGLLGLEGGVGEELLAVLGGGLGDGLGALVAGFLEGLRSLCDQHGLLLIFDEVQTGLGRTGKWFAYQHSSVEPDLIVFAKGVNSGYVPLGGVVISKKISEHFNDRVFPGGLTYSGHPLACAAAVATIDVMKEEKILENATKIGEEVLGPGLRELASRHHVIGEARGIGVFWALDLVTDRATRAPLAPYAGSSPAMNELVAECKKRGLMPMTNFNRLHAVPPCNISEIEAKEGLEILDQAFAEIDKHYLGAR